MNNTNKTALFEAIKSFMTANPTGYVRFNCEQNYNGQFMLTIAATTSSKENEGFGTELTLNCDSYDDGITTGTEAITAIFGTAATDNAPETVAPVNTAPAPEPRKRRSVRQQPAAAEKKTDNQNAPAPRRQRRKDAVGAGEILTADQLSGLIGTGRKVVVPAPADIEPIEGQISLLELCSEEKVDQPNETKADIAPVKVPSEEPAPAVNEPAPNASATPAPAAENTDATVEAAEELFGFMPLLDDDAAVEMPSTTAPISVTEAVKANAAPPVQDSADDSDDATTDSTPDVEDGMEALQTPEIIPQKEQPKPTTPETDEEKLEHALGCTIPCGRYSGKTFADLFEELGKDEMVKELRWYAYSYRGRNPQAKNSAALILSKIENMGA